MIDFKYDARKVDKAIAGLRKRSTNSKKVMDVIAKAEVKDARRRIRTTKEGPDGKSWAAWSYSTMKARQRSGTAARGILYLSGLLYRSFKMITTNKKMEIKNTAGYAGYLQNGTSRMPARPFLGFGKSSKKRIEKLFKEHIGNIK